jgi:hypothetical protein
MAMTRNLSQVPEPSGPTGEERRELLERARRELPQLEREFWEATWKVHHLNRLRFGAAWHPPEMSSRQRRMLESAGERLTATTNVGSKAG